jgi:hypothetical protein
MIASKSATSTSYRSKNKYLQRSSRSNAASHTQYGSNARNSNWKHLSTYGHEKQIHGALNSKDKS